MICIAAVFALVAPSVSAQSQRATDPSTILQGTVRDPGNHPVAGATVCLQSKDPAQTFTMNTDLEGNYRFLAPPAGTYTLRAEMAGYGEATVDFVVLPSNQARSIDLKLSKISASRSVETPEFFDEPHFTVAGVSDTTNLGGHGSDVVVRTTETLARDTASLGRDRSVSRPPDAGRPAEKALRDELARDPESFEANHQLGTMLFESGRTREGLPYLERASGLRPNDDGNTYELALARADAGHIGQALAEAQDLLSRHDTAELHHLLAEIEEKQASPLEAVREYQRAAEMNPSESNLFDWGAELLLHGAVDPALEVFGKGNRLFPGSARMLIGQGVSSYARGSYDQAVKHLCAASDLNPSDPTPYLFLGKLQSADATPSPASVEKLERFARLQPDNAQASYFYALSLWNSRQGKDDKIAAQVKSLLEKAVRLDSRLGAGFLQLGILEWEENNLPGALSSFQRAVDASPQLPQAHYRLAQAYRQAGDLVHARKELEIYEKMSRESAEQSVRERREIQQFVYTLRDGPAASKPR
jgi:tetratricopeptide (TPR) repeat protein